MPKFIVAKKVWVDGSVEADNRKQAVRLFEEQEGGRAHLVRDESGEDYAIIGRCEACGLVIFEDEEMRLGHDNEMFCAPCVDSLRDEEET